MISTPFIILIITLTIITIVMVGIFTTYDSFNYIQYTPSSVNKVETDDPIDMVYTWVDSTDKNWIKKKKLFEKIILNQLDNKPERYPNKTKPDAELELSLELSLQNVPWIKTIYIVTIDNQIPKCLRSNKKLQKQYNAKRIKMVHHDTLEIPVTFNSMAIESSLHKIPGLSNKFIYMNDDLYILKKCKKSYFFSEDKIIYRKFLHRKIPFITIISPYLSNWNQMVPYFKKVYINNHGAPWTLSKNIMKKFQNNYPDEFNRVRHSTFRNHDDIQPLGMALNIGLYDGDVISYTDDPLKCYNISSTNSLLTDKQLENFKNYHSLCLNSPSNEFVLQNIDILRKTFLK